MNVELGIVVQARLGSTRLPQKIIRPFANKKSILDIILEKFNTTDFQDTQKILATSIVDTDSTLEKYAKKANYDFFRGDETDVLNRFIGVGEKYGLTHLVRICSDNPFLHAPSVKVLINKLKERIADGGNTDYLSFQNNRQIPVIKTHLGLFAEIVSLNALKVTATLTNESDCHEHVTNFIYENRDRFQVVFLDTPHCVYDRHDIRLTIDDSSDFEVMSKLYEETKTFSDNIERLISYIDSCQSFDYKSIMIENIKKYTK